MSHTLDRTILKSIEAVIAGAFAQNRNVLYEHEVYAKDNIAARIVKVVHQYKKPTEVSVNVVLGIDTIYNKPGQTLDAGGVPAFLSAKRAMICLNAFIGYRLMRTSGIFSERLK